MVIARALNLSLVELYNSTLLQLEDILINKTDKIREAAEKSRRTMSSSILELTTMTSRLNDERKSTIITRKTTRVAIVKESITPLSTTIKVSFTKDHKLNSTVYSNGQSSSTMASSIVRSSYQTGVDLHKTNTIKYTIGKILSFVESVSISSAIAQSMFIEPSKKSIEKRLSTMSLTHSSGRTSSNDQNIQQSGSMLFLLSKSSPYIVVPAPYSKGIGNIKPRVTSLLPSIVSSISKDRENVPNSNTKEDDDSKLLMIFIPIIIVLLILIVVALFKSMKHKRQVKSIHIMSNKRYGLKSKNVSISPPISLANNESEVRAARSMLRISGVGNFETINEGDEPAKPEESDKSEVFDL
ncbi:uncharacterized protein LOC124440150 isoform X2 [Xenia sp. Carnegie-2017]|uniref:uncharacterized protein LOC124440150 isoform X2 n=1 Tax=Xenia sp. Carnegie-2017 TaxID=2897299 RepID=UPI001F04BC10|nr:uncharacterized protein LOC124440150 isoform X2 [Xenia sp. Carnegie-2017]